MCGRYASTRRDGDILREFAVASVVDEQEPAPSWNVAPTDSARVVLERIVGELPDRQLRTLSWGLVPSWAKDPKIGSKLINARSETVTTKPAFKAAASRRRCLVPADGYYEWMVAEGGKHPMYLFGDSPLAFAGLYELRPVDESREQWLWTYTILTCTATDEVGHIHDRSPVVVPPDLRDSWLDPAMADLAQVRDLVAAIPPPRLHTYEVAPLVNSVRNNGPELVQPLAS